MPYNKHINQTGGNATPSQMFKTNGSTHHNGIANELATIDLLNQHRDFAETVTHLGGTKHKADAMAGSKRNSIKHKAGQKNGSLH